MARLTFVGAADPIGELMMTVLAGIAKFERARRYGISRETVFQYLRGG